MSDRPETTVPLNDTRALILTKLLNGDLTALDLEDEIGINESAIRRHLDTLQKKGLVEPYFEKASRGRPKKKYKLTKSGNDLFPQKTPTLFLIFLKVFEDEYGNDELNNILKEVANELSDRIIQDKDYASFEEKFEDFVESMDDFGYFPKVKEKNGYYKIIYRNCVFDDISENLTDELCNMHREVVKNILPSCEVKISENGEESPNCIHKIKKC